MDDGGGTPNPLVNRPTVIIGFGTEGWIAQFAGSGSFEGVQPKLGICRRCRVEQEGDPVDARRNLLEQFQPLAGQRRLHNDET